jgi:hypothetical protein
MRKRTLKLLLQLAVIFWIVLIIEYFLKFGDSPFILGNVVSLLPALLRSFLIVFVIFYIWNFITYRRKRNLK